MLKWTRKWAAARIRRRLEAGGLPRISGRTWVHLSHGRHRCPCCRGRIRAGGREYEVPEGDPHERLYAHPACFKLWVIESQRNPVRAERAPRVHARAMIGAVVAILVTGLTGRRQDDSVP